MTVDVLAESAAGHGTGRSAYITTIVIVELMTENTTAYRAEHGASLGMEIGILVRVVGGTAAERRHNRRTDQDSFKRSHFKVLRKYLLFGDYYADTR